MTTTKMNYINHIALVLDASGSMGMHTETVVKVAGSLVERLARRSKELDQETRITIYTFADRPECVIYDKDVLRLPSIKTLYQPHGRTALVDAALLSQEDLALTPEKYGDHAFLTYILTDGEENESRRTAAELAAKLRGLPDNWTVCVLVPDMHGKHEAKQFGFPADNITIWDTTTRRGVEEAGDEIWRATDRYMTDRAAGIRGSKTMFSMGTATVNNATVTATGLTPLKPHEFLLIRVNKDRVSIKEFVENSGHAYKTGKAFYQLSKTETIQAQKDIAIVEKKTNKVYLGHAAVRQLLGLPDMEVRVKPEDNPDFTVFVQSTSVNRLLVVGTELLLRT